MLSEGATSSEVGEHLGGCASCSAWGEALGRVRSLAPSAIPPAPEGLSDRVLAAVRRARVAPLPPAPSWWRRAGFRAALAAGAAAAVALGALALPNRGARPTPAEELVAATRATGSVRTARMSLDASFHATFQVPADLPDLAGIRHGLEQLPKDARESAERLVDQADLLRRQAAAPHEVSLRLSGTGEAVLPDRMHIRGTFEGTAPSSAVLGGSGPFEFTAIGDRAWLRTPVSGDKWVLLPAGAGSVRIALDPGGVLDLLRAPQGPVERVGEETLDGARVVHYRLRVGSVGTGASGGSLDTWVGEEDQIVRRVRMRAEGHLPGAEIRSSFDVRLFDFGADVSVSPPPDGDVIAPDVLGGAAAFAFSFDGSGISLSLHGGWSSSPGFESSSPPPAPMPSEWRSPSPPPSWSPPPGWESPSPWPSEPYPTPSGWSSPDGSWWASPSAEPSGSPSP
ncbi:MAG: hypothetical protein HY775_11965 [Acidobacteria bacterium]|nr:hypothetical protein [Acidobacteriota bacterium]